MTARDPEDWDRLLAMADEKLAAMSAEELMQLEADLLPSLLRYLRKGLDARLPDGTPDYASRVTFAGLARRGGYLPFL
jgi:hypothetical protein